MSYFLVFYLHLFILFLIVICDIMTTLHNNSTTHEGEVDLDESLHLYSIIIGPTVEGKN